MDKNRSKRTEEEKRLKVGEGFNEARGDNFRESAHIPKHNGLNVNNDPDHQSEKQARSK